MIICWEVFKQEWKGRYTLTKGEALREKNKLMPQSLVKNYVHLVFSTKYREHLIHPPEEEELYAYLGDECKRMECHPIKIGGYTDHVHILCMLSKKIALMKLLEEVKSHSSKWYKTKADYLSNFYWQDARLNGTGRVMALFL